MGDWIKIAKAETVRVLGDSEGVHFELTPHRFHINGIYDGGSKFGVHTVFMSNGKYVLDGCEFDNEEFFAEYMRQIMENKMAPQLIAAHKMGHKNNLPPNISKPDRCNLDAVTEDWVIETFNNLTKEYLNSEKASGVYIDRSRDKITIEFESRSGRSRHDLSVTVNDRGYVRVDFDDTPFEGCEVESEFKKQLIQKISND